MVMIPDPLASAEKVVRAQLGSCYLEVVHEGAEALMWPSDVPGYPLCARSWCWDRGGSREHSRGPASGTSALGDEPWLCFHRV